MDRASVVKGKAEKPKKKKKRNETKLSLFKEQRVLKAPIEPWFLQSFPQRTVWQTPAHRDEGLQ
jgi:hypothetical protein